MKEGEAQDECKGEMGAHVAFILARSAAHKNNQSHSPNSAPLSDRCGLGLCVYVSVVCGGGHTQGL